MQFSVDFKMLTSSNFAKCVPVYKAMVPPRTLIDKWPENVDDGITIVSWSRWTQQRRGTENRCTEPEQDSLFSILK